MGRWEVFCSRNSVAEGSNKSKRITESKEEDKIFLKSELEAVKRQKVPQNCLTKHFPSSSTPTNTETIKKRTTIKSLKWRHARLIPLHLTTLQLCNSELFVVECCVHLTPSDISRTIDIWSLEQKTTKITTCGWDRCRGTLITCYCEEPGKSERDADGTGAPAAPDRKSRLIPWKSAVIIQFRAG